LNSHDRSVDIAIIGGGIQGAGMAREAALRGLSVALFEKGDFASGTSGRTSGLIHGGIRYLEQGAFGLVRQAVCERHLLSRLAPHLVRPIPFLLPIYRHDHRGRGRIRIGMMLYDLLAGQKNIGWHRMLSAAETQALEPALQPEGLRGAARFYDCQMDDARLCLAVLLSARALGATICNDTSVTGLIQKDGRTCGVSVLDGRSGQRYAVTAHVVVNAAGPWSDAICRMEGVPSRRIRPVKGIHILVPAITQHAVVVSSRTDRRIYFVIPREGFSLIGTTDSDYMGDLDDVRATREEMALLLSEIGAVIPHSLTPEQVTAHYAGVRPLAYAEGDAASDLSREGIIEWSDGGLLTLIGGKYTLFRSTAQAAMDQLLQARHYPHARPRRETPLHGGEMASLDAYIQDETASVMRHHPIPAATLHHLIGRYGTKYTEVLTLAEDAPDLWPLTSEGDPIRAEVVHAVRVEMALHLSDFMRRRTRLAFGPFKRDTILIDKVSRQMGELLGWDAVRRQEEIEAYLEEL
jgi:glycerol-3-phosphate dehydrogenase